MKKNKGFTLVELLVVVAIIAILAAVAIPNLTKQTKRARDAKALTVVQAFRAAAIAITAEKEGISPQNFGELADSVNTETLRRSYTANNLSTSLDNTSEVTSIFIGVGSSSLNCDPVDKNPEPCIQVDLDTTTGEISINSSAGTNTSANTWGDL